MLPYLVRGNSCQQKVDALGWVEGFTFSLQGVPIGIRVNNAHDLEEVRDLVGQFGPFDPWHDPGVEVLVSFYRGPQSKRRGSKNFHILYMQCTALVKSLSWSDVLDGFPAALSTATKMFSRTTVSVQTSWWKRGDVVAGILGPLHQDQVAALSESHWSAIGDSDVVFDLDGHRLAPSASILEAAPILYLGRGPKILGGAEAALRLMEGSHSARIDPELNLTILAKAAERETRLWSVPLDELLSESAGTEFLGPATADAS